ncbi:hypothetical protein BpHYR1_000136 [Brachionus plicatilis]|uniref:Uncharacterized protein n=1 Tax=Brachionus plicatilis TaxID=10195 RepID=A0A3M7SCX4_BRAPC|nr:hypothetical protein BpHYR1_000136 [Brachionus plicatilis]
MIILILTKLLKMIKLPKLDTSRVQSLSLFNIFFFSLIPLENKFSFEPNFQRLSIKVKEIRCLSLHWALKNSCCLASPCNSSILYYLFKLMNSFVIKKSMLKF